MGVKIHLNQSAEIECACRILSCSLLSKRPPPSPGHPQHSVQITRNIDMEEGTVFSPQW